MLQFLLSPSSSPVSLVSSLSFLLSPLLACLCCSLLSLLASCLFCFSFYVWPWLCSGFGSGSGSGSGFCPWLWGRAPCSGACSGSWPWPWLCLLAWVLVSHTTSHNNYITTHTTTHSTTHTTTVLIRKFSRIAFTKKHIYYLFFVNNNVARPSSKITMNSELLCGLLSELLCSC